MRTTVALCTLILLVTMTACGVNPPIAAPTVPPPQPTALAPATAQMAATASPAPTAVATLPSWFRSTQTLGTYRLHLFLSVRGEQADGHLDEGLIVDFTGTFQNGNAIEYRQLGADTQAHVIKADGQLYVRGPLPDVGLESPAWYQIDPAVLPDADPAYDLATTLPKLLGELDLSDLEFGGTQTLGQQDCDVYGGHEHVAQSALSRFLKLSPELTFDYPIPRPLRNGDTIDVFSNIAIALCPDGYLHQADVRYGIQTGDEMIKWQLQLEITDLNIPVGVGVPSDFIVPPTAARSPAPAATLTSAAAAEVASLVEHGRGQLAGGDARAAVTTLSQALAGDPYAAEAYVVRAEAHLALEQYAHAIDDATHAMALAPAQGESFRLRAQARYQTDDLRGAIADYTEALRLNSDDRIAYLGRGLAYGEGLGQWKEAEADYTQALRLDPSDISAYRYRGDARRHLSDEEGVIADYTEVIKSVPDDPQLYRWRAYRYMIFKNYQAALDDLNMAIRLEPDNADSFCQRGGVYLKLKEYAAVIRDSEEGMRLNPISRCAYRHRGDARRAQGDAAGALEDYQHYFELMEQCDCEDGMENMVRKYIRELEAQ